MANNTPNAMSALTKMVVADRLKGFSLVEIADRNSISVEDAAKTWNDYVSTNTRMSKEEQWILYYMRLENLLTKAHGVLDADESFESVETVLKVLTKIEELQNLNLSRKQEVENQMLGLSQQQAELMIMAFQAFAAGMQAQIATAIENNKTIKAIKSQLLDNFGEIVDEQMETAFKAIEAGNDEVI